MFAQLSTLYGNCLAQKAFSGSDIFSAFSHCGSNRTTPTECDGFSCFFDFAVPETPSRNCSGSAVNSTVIFLSWVLPLVPNGLIESYSVSYRPLQSLSGIIYTTPSLDVVIHTANNSTTILINQLSEATSYSFIITAFTIVGPGPTSSNECVVYTNEDGEVSLQSTVYSVHAFFS